MSESLRILVVEDNPADADLIRELLPQTGRASFHVESVARLAAALPRLQGAGIDLVLLDLGLPDSQGLATLRQLHQAAPDVPVIVRGDSAAQYQGIIDVINLCAKLGITQVGLATKANDKH